MFATRSVGAAVDVFSTKIGADGVLTPRDHQTFLDVLA
jgi:hypothetical protein